MNEMIINRGFDHVGEAYQNHFDMLKSKITEEHPEFNRMQVLALAIFFQEHRVPETYTVNITEEIYARLKTILNQPLDAPVAMIEEMECDLVFSIMEADNVF